MADNTTIAAMSGGDVIATDDIGGVKYERVKVNYGADGSATDVAPGAGLPIASAYLELTGSASANSTDLVASTDVRAYKSWSLQVTGTFVATFQVQGSNDNTNWFAIPGCQAVGTFNTGAAISFTNAAIFAGTVVSRYLRVRTTAYTSGTLTATLELTSQPSPSLSAFVYGAATSGDATSLTTGFGVGTYAWNGTTWDRQRVPTTFKTATATGSGDTALWTPTSAKKFRLMGYIVHVTGGAALASGADLDIVLRDGTTALNLGHSLYVPAIAGTALGGWSTGWLPLGNGPLSAAANNVLNVNLSAVLTAGKVRVTCCGTEE